MKTWQVIGLCMLVVIATISLILYTPVGILLAPILIPIATIIFPHIAPYVPMISGLITPLTNNVAAIPIIGTAITTVGGILVRRAQNQSKQIQAVAEQKISEANINAINDINALRNEYEQKLTTQKDAITTTLKSQYEPQITSLQEQVTKKTDELQQVTNERNEAQRWMNAFTVVCRNPSCQTRYSVAYQNCPKCQTPQMAIA